MRKAHENSLAGQVRFFSRLIVIILLIPTVISLVVTAAYAVSFHRSVSMMGNVAALRPVVEEIPERLWSVIAGRESFEESGVDYAILQVDRSLDSFLSQMGENKGTRITVARRTMDTLAAYSDRIEQEMADEKVPVTASEKTLEEVRSVAALIGDMLEAFIEDEALEVYRKNVSFQRSIFLVVGISLFLLLSALIVSGWAARRQTETMEGSIRQLELLTKEQKVDVAKLSEFLNVSQVTVRKDLDELESRGIITRAHVEKVPVKELSALTGDINTMAEQLEDLMEQNRREQENLKKAELRTLQAQINPHFLYNTLDTIVWQAESGKNDEVVVMTKALSDFFRSSLSSGEDWVTVEQELRHLNGYLSIQKARYRDILNYEVEADPSMNGYMILKLLLQPLVENALYHGIKYKRGGGVIRVHGMLQDGMLLFVVQDTGCGMTPERLEEIREAMRLGIQMRRGPNEPEPGGGFGLYNVDQRIRLYYSLDTGLHIESGPSGTTVSFRVPALKNTAPYL